VFQTGGSSVQHALDLAGNSLLTTAATSASLFAAFPATVTDQTTSAAFDWTPAAGAAATTGGLAAFSGKLATAAGTGITGTSYVGAADPAGAKWWQGWTVYSRR
jgi:hypothetical protein